MQEFNRVLRYLPTILSSCLSKLPEQLKHRVVELRIRLHKPILIITVKEHFYITVTGERTELLTNALKADESIVQETILSITGRALHSKQNELANGFITMVGGNRVGVAGTAIIEDGVIIGMKQITSLNIRFARNSELPDINMLNDVLSQEMFSLLIIGAPRTGKTTLLKSIASKLSVENKQVTVVDTRCEIAPNVGSFFNFCDVLSAFPRSEGIVNAIKSLAPQVIICDEIGNVEDAAAVEVAVNSGVNLVVTAHATCVAGAANRPGLSKLLRMGAFSDIAVMQSAKMPGIIKEVIKWNG